jgi:hypothetical protein
MSRFGASRFTVAALLAVSFSVPSCLPAQASDKPQPPAAPVAPDTATPVRTPPTAEQIGD